MLNYPPLIWVVTFILAVCFVVNLRMQFNPWLAAAVVLWSLFGLYERFIVDPRADIRVDLLLIYPLLVGVSVVGLIKWWKR